MVSVGAGLGGLVDDALQCRANGGVHRCGAGCLRDPSCSGRCRTGGMMTAAAWGSTVVRSASGVVGAGIGVVAPVKYLCAGVVGEIAAASGNSCVACLRTGRRTWRHIG